MTDPLTRLAILHGTDKYGYHDYTPRYHRLLGPLRDRPLRLLEIGVGGYDHATRGGESLAMWRDYFPLAWITGLDIACKTLALGPRVEIRQGSQVDGDCLSRLIAERGPFDVILDDGSHQNSHVVESFRLLFPTLASGGIYIIEDVQTAFFPKVGGSLTLKAPNSVAMALERAARLQEGRGGGIDRIERFHNLIVIHKRVARQKRALAGNDRHLAAAKARGRGVVTVEAGTLDNARLADLIAQAGEGGVIVAQGDWRDRALLGDLFAQVDHREIAVSFPEAPLHGFAARIAGLSIYPEAVLVLVGANSYPSNFAFDARDPQVASVLSEMGEVLKDRAASETALLRYLRLKDLQGNGRVGIEILDRLQAMGCRHPLYFLQRAEILIDRCQWADLLRLCREALAASPGNPPLTARLGLALRMTGQRDAALRLLRDAHARMPQALPVIRALAEAEFDCGNSAVASKLMAEVIERFPADEKPARLRDLIRMARAAGDARAALGAALRLQQIDPDAVSIHSQPATPEAG
ncbi:MAG: hypothetical protein ACK5IP_23610 [Paracoccus sp. (in: a-proteobacteria)]